MRFLQTVHEDLTCEQAEKRLASFVVVVALTSNKVQSGKRIGVITVGRSRIVRVVL